MDSMEYLERLCSYCYTTEIWYRLLEGGGAYTYSEILRWVGCSSSTLGRHLRYLVADGLVKMVGRKYQVVMPPWSMEMNRCHLDVIEDKLATLIEDVKALDALMKIRDTCDTWSAT